MAKIRRSSKRLSTSGLRRSSITDQYDWKVPIARVVVPADKIRVEYYKPFAKDADRRAYRLRFYVGTEKPSVAARAVLGYLDLASALGYSTLRPLRVVDGSLWAEFSAKVRAGWNARTTRRAANIARQSVEAWGVDRPMSKNANKMMTGASGFLESVKDADTVAADFGNLVIAQVTDDEGKKHVRVKALNARDVASRKYSDEIMSDPYQLFRQLPSKDGEGGS